MKLFDYKFLILLGLTLVVYFMFREIIDLRKKISTLEQSVDNITKKMITNNQPEEKSIFQIPLPGRIPGRIPETIPENFNNVGEFNNFAPF